MDEMYLTRLGNGNFDTGLDRAQADLDRAGFRFLPGGEGYVNDYGFPVKIFSRLPLWKQIAQAHRTWAGRQRN